MDHGVLQSPDHVSGMICHTDFACIIHHTWTVPEQTKDNTIRPLLRDMTWRFRDCFGR